MKNYIIILLSAISLFVTGCYDVPAVATPANVKEVSVHTEEYANPVSIFGSHLKFWENGIGLDGKVTQGTITKRVTSFVDASGNVSLIRPSLSPTINNWIIANGKSHYIKPQAVYEHQSKSYWNFFTNGSSWTIAGRSNFYKDGAGFRQVIFCNNNGTTSARGVLLNVRHDAANVLKMEVAITNGTSGQSILLASFNNVLPGYGQYFDYVITFNGTTCKLYINGILKGTQNKTSYSFSSLDATYNMRFNQLPNKSGDIRGELRKHLIILDTIASPDQIQELRDFMAQGSEVYTREDYEGQYKTGPLLIYTKYGQSNIAGEWDGPVPSDFLGVQPVLIWHTPVTAQYGNIEFLEHDVNQNCGSYLKVNPTLKFGRQLHEETGENILSITFGAGGTALYQKPTVKDWNAASTGEYLDMVSQNLAACIDDLKYAPYLKSYNYIVKGLIWGQGETECGGDLNGGPPVWNSDAANFLHAYLLKVNQAGINTSKMRICIMRVHNKFNPSRPYNELVRTQQVDVGENFLTNYYPQDSTLIKGIGWVSTDSCQISTDFTHFSPMVGVGQEASIFAEFFKPYVSEN